MLGQGAPSDVYMNFVWVPRADIIYYTNFTTYICDRGYRSRGLAMAVPWGQARAGHGWPWLARAWLGWRHGLAMTRPWAGHG